MGVGHLQTEHGLAHLDAGQHLLDGYGHVLGKHLHVGQFLVREVEDVVDLALGDNQRVAFGQGINVEEGVEVLVFGTLVAGNLSSHDT